jgi:hypothetical protein
VIENSAYPLNDDILEKEARLLACYLIDSEPPPEMVVCYVDANRKLDACAVNEHDARMMKFVLAHPWSVPLLDAAAGFLQPDSLLRKKIYIMAAVLEASPRFAQQFLPKSLSYSKLFVNLTTNVFTAGIKVIIGIPIFYFLRKWIND